jgi:hypothetical protein
MSHLMFSAQQGGVLGLNRSDAWGDWNGHFQFGLNTFNTTLFLVFCIQK